MVNANKVRRNLALANIARNPESIFRKINAYFKKFGFSFGPLMRWMHVNNEIVRPRQEVPVRCKRKILDAYLADIEVLEEMLARELSSWKCI